MNEYELSDAHPAIIKLKNGRFYDIGEDELTHPRICQFYQTEKSVCETVEQNGLSYERLIAQLKKIKLRDDGLFDNLYDDHTKDMTNRLNAKYEDGDLAYAHAHGHAKKVRKIWYRIHTNFDEIEDLHRRRIRHMALWADYIYRHANQRVGCILIIKDMAAGTDADWSDMDAAIVFDVKDHSYARQRAMNSIARKTDMFTSGKRGKGKPPRTGHIDLVNNAYSFSDLMDTAGKEAEATPDFDGYETNTRRKNYLKDEVFGMQSFDGARRWILPLSVPILPTTFKRKLYEMRGLVSVWKDLMKAYNPDITDSALQNLLLPALILQDVPEVSTNLISR